MTLEGRDQGLKDVANAKSAQATSFWRPFVKMPASIPAEDQAKLRAEAEDVITHKVMPAYAKMLTFFDEEYVPKAVTSLAAESLPDGKAYYQSKILEYTTVSMTFLALYFACWSTTVNSMSRLGLATAYSAKRRTT